MVGIDKQEYLNKAKDLLLDKDIYIPISGDPTTRHKNKLIKILRTIKTQGGLSDTTYKRLYPTSAVPSKFYGLPKIHKQGTLLRPIVSSTNAVTYGLANELANIIRPLVDQSPTILGTPNISWNISDLYSYSKGNAWSTMI